MSIQPLQTPGHKVTSESANSRLNRIRAELAAIAREQMAEFERTIGSVVVLADEISEGGEAYSVGSREVARRVSAQLADAAMTLEALRLRAAS